MQRNMAFTQMLIQKKSKGQTGQAGGPPTLRDAEDNGPTTNTDTEKK